MMHSGDGYGSFGKRAKEISGLTLKWVFILYVMPTSFIGMWLAFNYFYKYVVYDSTAVQFRNGFIYTAAPQWASGGRVVLHPDGDVAVKSNVRYIEEHGSFIYGYRSVETEGGLDRRYYFICEAGNRCPETEIYSQAAFKEALEEKKLPYHNTSYFNPLKKEQIKEWIKVNLFLKNKVHILAAPEK